MSAFLFIANDRALDFVNTWFAGGDTVPDFAAFVSWLAAAGMLSAGEALAARRHAAGEGGARALLSVRALRSAIRRSVDAYVSGSPPDADDLAAINAHLERSPVRNALVAAPHGFANVRRVATDDPDALAFLVAEAARELFTRRDARSIRRCANEACTHYFYDASKNGTRRWCSMAACGNREKVAASRSRNRAT